jgi:hypothetical protein
MPGSTTPLPIIPGAILSSSFLVLSFLTGAFACAFFKVLAVSFFPAIILLLFVNVPRLI